MRVRLKKLELLDDDVVDSLSKPELVGRVKELQERLAVLQEYAYRSNRQTYGSKSEKSEPDNTSENKVVEPPSRGVRLKNSRANDIPRRLYAKRILTSKALYLVNAATPLCKTRG